ncbi:MAG: RagB/SusD family nutrient uptake outer membrane protein [Rhodothermaceae bacterium]
MKLKAIKYILLSLLLFGLFTGCEENFLEVKNPNESTPATFWNTKADAEKALVAAYSHLQNQVWGGKWGAYEMWEVRTCRSDLINLDDMWDPFGEMSRYRCTPAKYAIRDFWAFQYQGLLAANQIIENIDKINESDDIKKQITAEAKFLRAYYHYTLVTNFGNIVLRESTPKEQSEYFKAQATEAEVWASIQKDLTEAAPDLPQSYSSAWKGRATEGAARFLLGKAFMAEDKWSQAEAQFQTITGLGYELIDDYTSMFTGLNEWNKESIFEINYTLDLTGGRIETISSSIMKTAWKMESPNQYLLDLFGADTTVDGSQSKRAAGTLKPYNGSTVWNKYSYYDPETNNDKSSVYNGTNMVIMRYGDALLLLAESLNEQGKTSEAIGYINQVRTRSGVAGLDANMSQSDLREHIRHVERPLELADEGHRWYDLIRWYKTSGLQDVLKAHNREDWENFEQTDRFYPIPQNEVNANPKLKQNPGF